MDEELMNKIGRVQELMPVVERLSVWSSRPKYWRHISDDLRGFAELILAIPEDIETDDDRQALLSLEGAADHWLEDAQDTELIYEADCLANGINTGADEVVTCPRCQSGDSSTYMGAVCNNCDIQFDFDTGEAFDGQEDMDPPELMAKHLFYKLHGINHMLDRKESMKISFNEICYHSVSDVEEAGMFIHTLGKAVSFLNALSAQAGLMIAYRREEDEDE